ncbi:MAG TPA: efflux RND transporter permease subunit [Burkholderiaceae bacterium]|nr:efflux RND transporter permease subunit [Burkholderiaceae bacterium]
MVRGRGFNLSSWAIEHQPLVRYLMVVLLLGGLFAFDRLGQDEDPPFTFRTMVVRAYWPGATATQMAEQVTDKLEKKLQEAPGLDKLRSYSKPGETLIFVQLSESMRGHDVVDAWYQVRKKVSDMRGTLPSNVQGPYFNDEFGDVYGVMYAFSSDGFTYRELKDHVEAVRQQLLRVPNVAKVDLFGAQDEKIYIEISDKKLAQIGLDIAQLSAQIGAQNAVEGAGVLVLPTDNLQVRISGEFRSLDDLRQLPIRGNGITYKLSDIATVNRGYTDPPRDRMRAGRAGVEGREVIGLGVSMVKGGDIIQLGKDLTLTGQRLARSLPVGIDMVKVADQPRAVATSVNDFLRVLVEALVVVLGVSFLSLGLHTRPLRVDPGPGLVVLATIPLVLALTFLGMWLFGINLHKISLGALIVALGLLVDDAIIAVEMMVRKLEEGASKTVAVTSMYETTAMPMLTGTLITAAGFLPIAIAKSSAGEYTMSIFQVTAMALVISWFVAVLFVPLLGVWLLKVKPQARAHDAAELFATPFYSRFRALVDWCVEWRKTVIAITLAALALGIGGFRFIEQQFFPDSSRLELVVDLWLPEGSSLEATEVETRVFERWLAQQPELDWYVSYVGTGAPRFYLPQDQQFSNSNLAEVVVTPKDLASRDRLRVKMIELFRNDLPNLRGRVKLLPNGPPVSYPVQFRVQGPDARTVRLVSDQVKDIMRANPNTRGVNDNWNESVKRLSLKLDQDRARALGVSTQTLARAAQTLLTGTTIGQFREGDQLIDIVLRQPLDERAVMSRLAEANIATASGRAVPLSQLVKVEFGWEPGIIWRQDRDYAITVQSDVREGIQGQTVSAQIAGDPQLAALQERLPEGYQIAIAGAAEESSKAGAAIMANVPLMLFIVFTLLMLQLRTFSRSMLVFLTGPLGLIGASLGLLLFRAPFGFVAQLGVIAMFGMIIRNSVILVDQIERNCEAGMPTWDAIIEAAVRRLRPIVLTAAAAVLAMIPLSRSAFWGPMAIAIMGGLIVATALTLLFLPALYAAWFRVKRPAQDAIPAEALPRPV